MIVGCGPVQNGAGREEPEADVDAQFVAVSAHKDAHRWCHDQICCDRQPWWLCEVASPGDKTDVQMK